MFTEILVAIDFSERASEALRLAITLAQHGQGQITLVYIGLAAGLGRDDLPEPLATPPESVASGLKQELTRLGRAAIPDDIPWRAVTREGAPPEEIVAQAREGVHDLIVMGSHGRAGRQHPFLGSVTEHVLRRSPIPVLVAR